MKFIILLLTLSFVHISAISYGQQVSLDVKNIPLSQLFREIRKQTSYDFVYPDKLIQNKANITVKVKNKDVKVVLREILSTRDLQFSISENSIAIEPVRNPPAKTSANKPTTHAEQHRISGSIVNENSKPIAGALVWLKDNHKIGVSTNQDGRFSLNVPKESTRLFIYAMGYEKIEISSKSLNENGHIKLLPVSNNIDDVQVTGYGTTTKRLNAGNITTVTAKEIEKNPVNNVLAALQGKVPGLFIQQNSGQPGGSFNVRLRNAGNLASGPVAPLFIVDGVRYPTEALPGLVSSSQTGYDFLQGGNGLNFINPNDIERIDVLKDIDATAIYGSSGAYGVILITTKKSKVGTPTFHANIYSGVTVLGKTAPLLNTKQYLELRREALANDGLEPTALDLDLNGTWPQDRYTDWRKELLGTAAATHNMNLSYSGGSQNTSYRIGGSLVDIGNIQMNKGDHRNGSLSVDLSTKTPDNKFAISFSGHYMASTNTMIPIDFSSLSSSLLPNSPALFLPDGTINWDELVITNGTHPIANIYKTFNDQNTNLISSFVLNYKPTDYLTFHSNLAYTERHNKTASSHPGTMYHPATAASSIVRWATADHNNLNSITLSSYAQYRRTIAQKGEFSFQLGNEINNNTSKMLSTLGSGFSSDALLSNPYSATSQLHQNQLIEYRSIGVYGIAKFVWANKYIANFNLRRDGSTKFGPGRRFGNFGSAALAWVFSEENLIKNNWDWFSYGKLRGSTGTVGGDAVGNFAYLDNYISIPGSYDGTMGLEYAALSNSFLEWEKNFNSEVAIELGLFNNRFTADVSYYLNRAGNQLVNSSISAVTGFSRFQRNSDALIQNKGLEIMIGSTHVETKDFNWSSKLNISLPESKVLNLPTQYNNVNYVIGQPVNGILTYKYQGVNPETGSREYINAKGEIKPATTGFTQADKTEFINLDPDFFGGFHNTLRYKRVSLDFSFTFTKRKGKSKIAQEGATAGYFGSNGSTLWLDRWQKPGDVSDIPKLTTRPSFDHLYGFALSDGAYEDVTYAKLQNLSLRYAFNPDLLQKVRIKQLAIYFQGQNLFTISKYGGLDPENLSSTVLGPTRILTAGLNMTL